MKKIFTLISVAFVAMSVNAQEAEKWDASSLVFDETTKVMTSEVESSNTSGSYVIPESANVFPMGTWENNVGAVTDWLAALADPSIYATPLKEYTFTASTTNVTLKAVSTPNSDNKAGEEWQRNLNTNMLLNTDDCPIKWENNVKPKTGNPSLGYYDYYEYNSEETPTHRVSDVLWTIDCGQLPGKGTYYEYTIAKTGTLVMGVFLNRPNSSAVVVVEKDSKKVLPVSSLSFEGYCQNNTYKYNEVGFQKFNFRDDYTIDVSLQPSRPLLGYLTFPVEEGKSYLVFQPSSQVGIYGFQFTATSSGIETIATKAENPNAPIYNLAGQQVTKSYKGVVIQNGKKLFQK
ncbi:MAG: hypothetical protein IJJ68_06200 [Prevotella sp.]|nr:hypothetical protein [Prevotella sp.]